MPLVIAHRGASGERPEHTLVAYELAIDQGADVIEPDLVITGDGVLVARHESEISETTDVADRPDVARRRATKRIDGLEVTGWFTEDFTLAELKTLRARERLPFRDHAWDGRFEVPTLAEVLELAARKSRETGRTIGVYPETKRPSYFREIGLPLEEPLVVALHAAGYRGKSAPVFIQSFEVGNLKRLRGMTDLPLVQLLNATGRPWDHEATGGPSYHEMATPEGLAEIARYADGIGPHKRLVVPEESDGRLRHPSTLVDDAHAAGLFVHPWTFRSEAVFLHPFYEGEPEREIEQFLALGVDGLFTDFPGLAVTVRERWAARVVSSR